MEISVTGLMGEGKSTIAKVIFNKLKELGFNVSLSDIDFSFNGDSENYFKSHIENILKNNPTIHITVSQISK